LLAHNISFTIGLATQPSEGLKVKTDDIARWAANSDVHITSSTLNWRDSQDAVIDSIQAKDDGTSILKLNVGIDAVLSEKETPRMGVEVALLTRNIKIEGEIRADLCGSDLIKQADYRGTIATSANGLMCQKWTVQTPNAHTRTPANYPNAGLGGEFQILLKCSVSLTRTLCIFPTLNSPLSQYTFLDILQQRPQLLPQPRRTGESMVLHL
jgi:hypothetical protein